MWFSSGRTFLNKPLISSMSDENCTFLIWYFVIFGKAGGGSRIYELRQLFYLLSHSNHLQNEQLFHQNEHCHNRRETIILRCEISVCKTVGKVFWPSQSPQNDLFQLSQFDLFMPITFGKSRRTARLNCLNFYPPLKLAFIKLFTDLLYYFCIFSAGLKLVFNKLGALWQPHWLCVLYWTFTAKFTPMK